MMSITATPVLNDGAPRVELTIDDIDPTGQFVSVEWSVDDGRTWMAVHQAAEVEAFGGLFVRDFLCPLNVSVTYRAVAHSGDPIPDSQATLTVRSDYAWISDPLRPRVAIPVTCRDGYDAAIELLAPSIGRYARQQVVHRARPPMGGRLAPVSAGPRLAAEGIELVFSTIVNEQAALVNAIRDLIGQNGQGGTFALRGLPATFALDAVAHVVAPTVYDSPAYEGIVGMYHQWEMTVDQVAGPSLQIQIPWWSYAQVRDEWDGFTYAQVMAARPGATYIDWLRDPTRP